MKKGRLIQDIEIILGIYGTDFALYKNYYNKKDNDTYEKKTISKGNIFSKVVSCELLSLLLRYKEYESLFVPPSSASSAASAASDSSSASDSSDSSSDTTVQLTKYFYNYEQALYLTF